MLEQMGIAAKAASYKLALLTSQEKKPRAGEDCRLFRGAVRGDFAG